MCLKIFISQKREYSHLHDNIIYSLLVSTILQSVVILAQYFFLSTRIYYILYVMIIIYENHLPYY